MVRAGSDVTSAVVAIGEGEMMTVSTASEDEGRDKCRSDSKKDDMSEDRSSDDC